MCFKHCYLICICTNEKDCIEFVILVVLLDWTCPCISAHTCGTILCISLWLTSCLDIQYVVSSFPYSSCALPQVITNSTSLTLYIPQIVSILHSIANNYLCSQTRCSLWTERRHNFIQSTPSRDYMKPGLEGSTQAFKKRSWALSRGFEMSGPGSARPRAFRPSLHIPNTVGMLIMHNVGRWDFPCVMSIMHYEHPFPCQIGTLGLSVTAKVLCVMTIYALSHYALWAYRLYIGFIGVITNHQSHVPSLRSM